MRYWIESAAGGVVPIEASCRKEAVKKAKVVSRGHQVYKVTRDGGLIQHEGFNSQRYCT